MDALHLFRRKKLLDPAGFFLLILKNDLPAVFQQNLNPVLLIIFPADFFRFSVFHDLSLVKKGYMVA